METQIISYAQGYNLFIRNLPNNFYHVDIVDPDERIHHFEGIYSSPQVAIAKGKSTIDNLIFWRAKTAREFSEANK